MVHLWVFLNSWFSGFISIWTGLSRALKMWQLLKHCWYYLVSHMNLALSWGFLLVVPVGMWMGCPWIEPFLAVTNHAGRLFVLRRLLVTLVTLLFSFCSSAPTLFLLADWLVCCFNCAIFSLGMDIILKKLLWKERSKIEVSMFLKLVLFKCGQAYMGQGWKASLQEIQKLEPVSSD